MRPRSFNQILKIVDYWQPVILAAESAAERYINNEILTKYNAHLSTLNNLAYSYASNTIESLGLFQDAMPTEVDALYSTGKILSDYKNSFIRLLDLCVASGVLVQKEEGKFFRKKQWLRPPSETQIFNFQADMDDSKPLFDFVNELGRAMPDILSGRRHAAEFLFRDGRLDTALQLYEKTPPFRYCNAVTSKVITELSSLLSQQGRMRIVEIGAGSLCFIRPHSPPLQG